MLLMRVAWLIVILVGVLVLSLVFGLQLFHRLDDGQKVLDDAEHLFRDDAIVAQRTASDAVNTIAGGVSPILDEEGGAAADVGPLIAFLSSVLNLTEDEVVEVLQEEAPKTLNLLLALPLEDVTAELYGPDAALGGEPGLLALVAELTGLSEDEVVVALQENVPNLTTTILALPTITAANTVRTGLTDADENELVGLAGIATYLDDRIVDVTNRQSTNFQHTNGIQPNLNGIPWLLVGIGGLVVFFGGLMFLVTGRMRFEASPSVPPRRRAELGEVGGAPPRIGSS